MERQAVNKAAALNHRMLAYKIIGTQMAVATIFPILFLLVGRDAAISALIGGWIATLSNAYFGAQAFRYSGARAAQKMVQSFYRGEAGKFIITIVFILVVFEFVEVLQEKRNALSLFVMFSSVHLVAWFAPMILKSKVM